MKEEKAFLELRKKERETRKNLILDTALTLFEEKTLSKTTMNDIAGAIGASTATLYGYFSSQEELLLEAFIRDLSSIDQIMKSYIDDESVLEQDQNGMEVLAEAIVGHLMNSEATFQMISLLITRGGMPDHLLEKLNDFRQVLNERLIRVFKASGIQRPDKTTARTFFASILGVIMLFRNYPEKDMDDPEESIKAMARHIVQMFKSGVPASD